MVIFQKSVIQKYLNNLDKGHLEKAYLKYKENKKHNEKNIRYNSFNGLV